MRFGWGWRLYVAAACALFAYGSVNAEETPAQRNLRYADGAGAAHQLDFYPAASAEARAPLVIYIHGGGWRAGDKSKVPGYILKLTKEGIAVAAVNYRLSQQAKYPAQLFDIKAAVRFMRAHADEFHIDPQRIAAWGLSAGGQLAALLGTTAHDPALEGNVGADLDQSSKVAAVVNYYGPTSLPDKPIQCAQVKCLFPQTGMDATVSQLLGCDIAKCTDRAKAASPIDHIAAGAPPFLNVHGDKDNIVPLQQSINFDAALAKAGVHSRLIVVPGGRHGWDGETPYDEAARTFLVRQLEVDQPAVAAASGSDDAL